MALIKSVRGFVPSIEKDTYLADNATIIGDGAWLDKDYRGKNIEAYQDLTPIKTHCPVYKEHNEDYLIECIENLKGKNIFIRL